VKNTAPFLDNDKLTPHERRLRKKKKDSQNLLRCKII